jgi:hypothetical protein
MSRVSRKSELSPSITRGSNAIDLGKNSGVDMGRKAQPSITSGGIGITQEVTSIAGVSVNAGVNVDITPVDFGISVSPSDGTISVATGAEIPGGLLGVSGGIEIDANTGQITGGSIGGEALGLGINVSNSRSGGLGIEFTVQIPGTPIELSLGFGFPPKEDEPTPTPTPTPTPSPTPSIPAPDPFPLPPLPFSGGGDTVCTVIVAREVRGWEVDAQTGSNLSYFVNSAEGAVDIISSGHLTISGSHYYKDNRQELTTPFSNIIPSWRDGNLYSYSGYGLIFGASGRESVIYDVINREAYGYRENNYIFTIGYSAWTYKVIYSDCPLSKNIPSPSPSPSPIPPPFPNPPPRRQNRMDSCCRENLAFLRAIYKKLGLAKFPGQLPSTIIQEVPKEGEQPAEPPQVPIEDLVDLVDWQFRRDDERWGQWIVQIDVKDADLTKEGNQGKQIKFPNLAESIAELEGQMLSVMANVDALVAMQVKNLAESGMARQEAIKAYLAAKAIIKYMAFKSTEIDVSVPMTFTPGGETISELIKESEGHIKGTDYAEKETFRDVCLDLLQAAAIIRAVHWQKIDSKNDTKTQLLNLLKGTVDLAGIITNPKKSTIDGEEKKFDPSQNFEDFLDNVEDGFRNTTGVTDIQNPYGKTPDRRPRIREIGDNISQAGSDN